MQSFKLMLIKRPLPFINHVLMFPVKKEKLMGWGNYPVSESAVVMARDENDFKKIIQEGKFITRGLGRSYADQATNNNGYVAVCTKMNYFLSWNEQQGILDC